MESRPLVLESVKRKGSPNSIKIVIAIVIGLIFALAVVSFVLPSLEDGFSTVFALSGDDIG